MSPATTVHTAEVLPPRALLFLGIVAVHAVLAWFLGNSLIRTVKDFIAPPVQLVPLDNSPPVEQRPVEPLNPTLEIRSTSRPARSRSLRPIPNTTPP